MRFRRLCEQGSQEEFYAMGVDENVICRCKSLFNLDPVLNVQVDVGL